MATSTRTRKKAVKVDVPGTTHVQSRILTRHDGEAVLKDVKDEFEELEVQVFETEPAYVEASAGVTKSLREYESLRVDVRMRIPCYTERVDKTFEYAAGWVADRLYEEVDNYFGEEGDDDGKS